MKRLYSAIGLCIVLLIFEAAVFLPASKAKEDIVTQLLQVPAPPPANPLAHKGPGRTRDLEFYSKSNIPKDDASIDDLIDYWSENQRAVRSMTYSPEASEKTLERLYREVEKDPLKLPKLLGAFPDNERAAGLVKGIYDREGTTGVFDKDARTTIKQWLTYHSPYYSSELYRLAEKAGDTDSYVTNQDEILALARVDFEKARPLLDRLYASGSDKATRVLARWAFYRHALDTDSIGDIERYRDELKSSVENKSLSGPTRDLAMDALVTEKEWSGRDDWYVSLLPDETLADLKGYTGLTTLMNVSPPDKYIDKMLELVKSDNKYVRSAAVRNLLLQLGSKRADVIAALLPWLEDPNWAADVNDSRSNIVLMLRTIKVPESVPALIKILDERKKQVVYAGVGTAANGMSNTKTPTINTGRPSNASNSSSPLLPGMSEVERFAYRYAAVLALGFQADPSAGPALRRILPEMEGYERSTTVESIMKCRGFTVPEQVDALETAAKRQVENFGANAAVNAAIMAANAVKGTGVADTVAADLPLPNTGPITAANIKEMLGEILLRTTDVSDELATATTRRIEELDRSDRVRSDIMRKIIVHWPNQPVDLLFLRDVKSDRSDVESIVRLLSQRRSLRRSAAGEISDAASGKSSAAGIATCLVEDPTQFEAILNGENAETKAAFLACARLIRSELPVAKVAEFVKSTDKRLALAAERYLEAEDSPAARSIVLALHPGQAKILGATTAFFPTGRSNSSLTYLKALFESVESSSPDSPSPTASDATIRDDSMNDGEGEGEGEVSPEMAASEVQIDWRQVEKTLQAEVKKDMSLMGVYAYAGNYVRIYKDRVVFSFDDDVSRYRERPLNPGEFDALKNYLNEQRVDELPPFLQCADEYCTSKELLMLSRSGGRRVYLEGEPSEFFVGLDKFFAEVRLAPTTLKYALSREIPGLEILLADDNLHAETVWKNGDDMRVAVSDQIVRKKVKEEIETAVEKATENEDANVPATEEQEPEIIREKLRVKREFDGYSWRKIVGGADGGPAAQPPQIELIPARDGLAVQATREQWKARTATFEIRASDGGLFKVSNGKLSTVKPGYSDSPVITPDGKWVIAYHTGSGDDATALVRINLLTNRMSPVKTEEYLTFFPYAYVPTLRRVLIVMQNQEGEGYEGEGEPPQDAIDDAVSADPSPEEMMLLDPETGAVQPIAGEFRPLAQQTFRQLQPTGKPNEFWAAIANTEKNETQVGIYETNHFGFKPLLRIPKITFNSMSMWVDEPGKKVYFVYRGHLLSLPLKTSGI